MALSPLIVLGLVPIAWLLFALLNLASSPRAVRSPSDKGLPKLSVLVPARNAARHVGPCVASLVSQTYPDWELILLDDDSIDGTAAIARAAAGDCERFRLLRGRPLPEGWLGTSWACQQLAAAARGEFLLFLAADVIAAPGMLQRAVATAIARRTDLLSGFPMALGESLGERFRAWQQRLVVTLFLPLWLVPFRNHCALVAANRAFLLFRQETYRRIGGHAAIRGSGVDHLALGRLVKQNRGRVLFANLADLYACRIDRSGAKRWRGIVRTTARAFRRRSV
jgi:chlorobactene glucosyltransferase